MKNIAFITLLPLLISCNTGINKNITPRLKVSENKRFLVTEKGDPFFWLGDTGWLLFAKLNREEACKYFDDRRLKGFNVIQVMVIHDINKAVNAYGDSAISSHDISKPLTTPGSSFSDSTQYDYWDHVDYLVKTAGEKGLYMALVPVWGSNVRSGKVSREQAEKYAEWLASRYKDSPNVIWLNGGDVKGSDSTSTWNTIGSTIRKISPAQLITFHPFGRTQSSEWFHNEEWLDFNMFQSGHRRYDQDTTGLSYGEDNWRYVNSDYGKTPVKPTLDGEPSYEGIPQGLHDASQPYWNDSDVRRYAWWSVFAGGCGFTYGNNAIMQFHIEGEAGGSYGVKKSWEAALNDPGASQMQYLKKLILSKPYPERVPAQELIAGEPGKKYDYLAATRGKDYALIYTCNGSTIKIDMDKLGMKSVKASWYNPRNGEYSEIGSFNASGIKSFEPKGGKSTGNDHLLILAKEK